MASQRKSKRSTQVSRDETNAAPVAAEKQNNAGPASFTDPAIQRTINQATTRRPFQQPGLTRNSSAPPTFLRRGWPGRHAPGDTFDEEEEEEYVEEDIDYEAEDVDNEEEASVLPIETVANDNPDVVAILRTSGKKKTAPFPLPDYLLERDDPRASAVKELTMPLVMLPASDLQLNASFMMFVLIASPYFFCAFNCGSVYATVYPGTELFSRLRRYGPQATKVRHRHRTRTTQNAYAAAERCRLRLILNLFDLEEADLKPSPDGPLASRTNQLVRSLRRNRHQAIPRVSEAILRQPDLGQAVLDALAMNSDDHEMWELLMDVLKPTWRRGISLATKK